MVHPPRHPDTPTTTHTSPQLLFSTRTTPLRPAKPRLAREWHAWDAHGHTNTTERVVSAGETSHLHATRSMAPSRLTSKGITQEAPFTAVDTFRGNLARLLRRFSYTPMRPSPDDAATKSRSATAACTGPNRHNHTSMGPRPQLPTRPNAPHSHVRSHGEPGAKGAP